MDRKFILLLASPYLLISFLTLHFINEDAYIYFRVAENIANGHGYVFNIGGEHIETGSSLPWQILFALLSFTGIHLLIWAKLIGISLGCINLWLTWKIAQHIFEDKSWAIYPALATAFSTSFYMWMQLGLDAPLNTFCLLWLAWCLLIPGKQQYWHWAAIAVFYARPEGFFYLLVLLPWLAERGKNHSLPLKQIFIVVSACSALVVFRLFYFHDLLPHAFYHKIGMTAASGARIIFDYFIYNFLFLFMAVLLGSFMVCKTNITKPNRSSTLILASFTIICLTWASIGYDWNSYNRHIGTALPFFYLLLFYGFSLLPTGKANIVLKSISALILTLSLLFGQSVGDRQQRELSPLFSSTINLFFSPEARFREFASVFLNPDFEEGKFDGASGSIGVHFMANLGRFLKLNYPANSVVVWDQLGRTPWFAGQDFVFIDNTGLCYRDIAFQHYHERIKRQDSKLHKLYEGFINKLTGILWPEEKRPKSEQQIINELLEKKPAIIIARTRYLKKRPDSLLLKIIEQGGNFEKSHLVHNSFLIFENRNLLNNKPAIVPRNTIVSSYIDGKLVPVSTKR